MLNNLRETAKFDSKITYFVRQSKSAIFDTKLAVFPKIFRIPYRMECRSLVFAQLQIFRNVRI